jgi:hypothetical protein
MIANSEVTFIGRVVQKIFAVAQERRQADVGIPIRLISVGAEFPPPDRK